jgi:hypothetical protein
MRKIALSLLIILCADIVRAENLYCDANIRNAKLAAIQENRAAVGAAAGTVGGGAMAGCSILLLLGAVDFGAVAAACLAVSVGAAGVTGLAVAKNNKVDENAYKKYLDPRCSTK